MIYAEHDCKDVSEIVIDGEEKKYSRIKRSLLLRSQGTRRRARENRRPQRFGRKVKRDSRRR